MYDPDLATPIWVPLGSPGTSYHFNLKTNIWTQKGNVPAGVLYSDVASTYDSNRKKHIISTPNGIWLYDAPADTWTQINNVPSSALGSGALAYDPVNKITILLGRGALWVYNESGQWSQTNPSGGPALSDQGARFGTLVYDSTHHVFIFLNLETVGGNGTGGVTHTWAYRYRKASDIAPPSPPQHLRIP
jgi:hypothetical protein